MTLGASDLDEARRDWTILGRDDALWAVVSFDGKKDGGWDLDDFLATGRQDVAWTRAWLTNLGRPTEWERVLDFGCGVGRLSQALAAHAAQVIGVDISPTMLETARRLDQTGGACLFVQNDTPDLAHFPDAHFDLVTCILVLQHLPRGVVDGYLAEFLRVLRPGGTAVVQLVTRPAWTAKGMIWRTVPVSWIRFAQRRLLGYPAPMRMTSVPDGDLRDTVARLGGVVVGSAAEPTPTKNFVCTRYALRRA